MSEGTRLSRQLSTELGGGEIMILNQNLLQEESS